MKAESSSSSKTFSPLDPSNHGQLLPLVFAIFAGHKADVAPRGIGNFILSKANTSTFKTPHFYISSGGNAGLACVAAAASLGYPASVVVPMSTKPHMIDLIRLAGASEVVQEGASWFEADTHLRETILPQHPEGIYVPPFDDQLVWDGAATIIDEVREQCPALPEAVVCSVGGGGLFSGIMQGVGDSTIRVIASETSGAESLNASVKAGELVTLPGITSIATSLGAIRVTPKAYEYAQDERVSSVVVSDAQAVKACIQFANEERMLVEPACGAALAVAYEGLLTKLIPDFSEKSCVVLVVCGGSNVSLQHLEEWKNQFGGS